MTRGGSGVIALTVDGESLASHLLRQCGAQSSRSILPATWQCRVNVLQRTAIVCSPMLVCRHSCPGYVACLR